MIENNRYIASYLTGVIQAFRFFDKNKITICIKGIKRLASLDCMCLEFVQFINKYDIHIILEDENINVSSLGVICTSLEVHNKFEFSYQLSNLTCLLEISSESGISLLTLIVMKIISACIARVKIIYKALVIDLDETLWKGTLSEEGITQIVQSLKSESGKIFIHFMNFISAIAKDLGVYIGICTRNELGLVRKIIDELDENIFPLKNQIDCVVANNNEKSANLLKIAEQLSILPNAIIFIDDNGLIRDEVREKDPRIFVPEWVNHDDLILQLKIGGYFDRLELSVFDQNRKRNFRFIQEERFSNSLPFLEFNVHEDIDHIESIKLYSKTNQFKLNKIDFVSFTNAKSLYFELFRRNGESLGICSCITYCIINGVCLIINWAISCRFFEIGLEESVLLFMLDKISKNIAVICQFNENNLKAKIVVDKYFSFKDNKCSFDFDGLFDCSDIGSYDNLSFSTKDLFKEIESEIGSFDFYMIADKKTELTKNTNLILRNYE